MERDPTATCYEFLALILHKYCSTLTPTQQELNLLDIVELHVTKSNASFFGPHLTCVLRNIHKVTTSCCFKHFSPLDFQYNIFLDFHTSLSLLGRFLLFYFVSKFFVSEWFLCLGCSVLSAFSPADCTYFHKLKLYL